MEITSENITKAFKVCISVGCENLRNERGDHTALERACMINNQLEVLQAVLSSRGCRVAVVRGQHGSVTSDGFKPK